MNSKSRRVCDDCGKDIEDEDTEYPWWCNKCCDKHFKEFWKLMGYADT